MPIRDTATRVSAARVSATRTTATHRGDASKLSLASNYGFAVTSDFHIGRAGYDAAIPQAVFADAVAKSAEFIIVNGDMTDLGSAAELADYKTLVDGAGLTVHTCAGNHEVMGYCSAARGDGSHPPCEARYLYAAGVGVPSVHHTWEQGADRFIVIDNTPEYINQVDRSFLDLDWVEENLVRDADYYRHQFVIAHTPIVSAAQLASGGFFNPTGSGAVVYYAGQTNAANGAACESLLDLIGRAGNVAAVFFGHTHAYCAYTLPNGTTAYITGAASPTTYRHTGAPLVAGDSYTYVTVSDVVTAERIAI